MTIWSEFKTVRKGKSLVVNLDLILREQDYLKKYQTIAEQKVQIHLPQKTSYIILQDKHEKTKAKLRIQPTRTRY